MDVHVAVIELHKKMTMDQTIIKMTDFKNRTIYNAVKQYKKTGKTKDRPRRDRRTTATTPENIDKLRFRISQNSRLSMRKMTTELEINTEHIRNIVKIELKL